MNTHPFPQDESKDDYMPSTYDRTAFHRKDDDSYHNPSTTLPAMREYPAAAAPSSSSPRETYDQPARDTLYPSIDPTLQSGIREHYPSVSRYTMDAIPPQNDDGTSTTYYQDKPQSTLYQDAMSTVSSFLDHPTVKNLASAVTSPPASGASTTMGSAAFPPTSTTTTTTTAAGGGYTTTTPTLGQTIGSTIGSLGGGLLDGSIDRQRGTTVLLDTLKTGLLTLGQPQQQQHQQSIAAGRHAPAGDLGSSISAVTDSFNQLQHAVGQVGEQATNQFSGITSAIRGLGGLFRTAHPQQPPQYSPPQPSAAGAAAVGSVPATQTAPTDTLTGALQAIQGISTLAANVNAVRDTLGSTFGGLANLGGSSTQQQYPQSQPPPQPPQSPFDKVD